MIHDDKDMTPLRYPKNCTKYPYVGRYAAREDHVNFMYQFVKKSGCSLDDKLDKNVNVSSYAEYICGIPKNFPNYGDFPESFVMRTYGLDISISPWQDEAKIDYTPQDSNKKIWNYIDIAFHKRVYPIRVSIYEICNPGNIIEIWAQDPKDEWFLLWKGSPQIVPPTSRLFSPPLRTCNFKTKKFRLVFKNTILEYFTSIDAVMLIGTSKLILPKKPLKYISLTDVLKRINRAALRHEDVHNLTADYETAHLDICKLRKNVSKYCIIHESDEVLDEYNYTEHTEVSLEEIPDYVLEILCPKHRKLSKDTVVPCAKYKRSARPPVSLLDYPSPTKRMKLSLDESKKLLRCSLSALPDEIIVEILKNLDFMTLCSMSWVNKRFKNLTLDPRLYRRLNVRNTRNIYMDPTYINNIFSYFTLRCKFLQQLDLTYSDFSISHFKEFLENCGSHLTHLRLCKCEVVNNDALLKISKVCKNLKELDLRYCQGIENEGFSYLENLEGLERLRLGFTKIRVHTLCKILRKNQRIRELNLEQFGCEPTFSFDMLENPDMNFEAVALELRRSCQNLEIINLASAFNVTLRSINTLAGCKNLRIVNLRICTHIISDIDGVCKLFLFCQRLEEVHLFHTFFTDYGLDLLTQCKNLKQLHLYNCNMELVAPETYSKIFEQCLELKKFHLLCCKFNHCLTEQWKKNYPHVSIHAV